jgi:heme exporter protein A
LPGAGPILRTEGLSKQFGRLSALRSVSTSVAAGEFVTIFGRNGAGKTTFLRIVSSLVRSYSGTVSLFGRNLKKADEATRNRIGFLSHDSFLYKDLSALDNLVFFGKLYRVDPVKSQAERMLERVGLGAKRNMPVRTLSRGMKQRLSLARAFLHRPEFLLMDEPYTGLDEEACERLDGLFSEFVQQGGSIVLTTHNISRGLKQAHRILVFDRGRIVYEAAAGETREEAFLARYKELIAQPGGDGP